MSKVIKPGYYFVVENPFQYVAIDREACGYPYLSDWFHLAAVFKTPEEANKYKQSVTHLNQQYRWVLCEAEITLTPV